MKALERILVCRADRIGDLMLTLPVFDAVKAKFPQAHVTALVTSYTADLLQCHPSIDEVILHDPKGEHSGWVGIGRLAHSLAQRRFDAALAIYGKADLALALWRAGIPIRVGNGYRLYNALLSNHRLWLHRSKQMIHEKDYALRFAQALGAKELSSPSHLFWTQEEESELGVLSNKAGFDFESPFVVVHPGNAGSARNLSETSYAAFADSVRDRGLSVVLTGASMDTSSVSRVKELMKKSVYDLSNKLSLRQLAILLSRAQFLVISSTGPLHIASAVGTPSIAFFSPVRAESPIKWGPLHKGSIVLKPSEKQCLRCSPNDCNDPCMDAIKISDFEEALTCMLGNFKKDKDEIEAERERI